MTRKPVYRNGELLGHARTWCEVAKLLGDPRPDAGTRLSREHSEGPEGFYLRQGDDK